MMKTALLAALFASTAAIAQNDPAVHFEDNVALGAYLDALAQISPAAREGAAAYLDAYRRRCGRSMRTVELRQAVAKGAGDPVLMAMMRAAAVRDTRTLQRLSDTVSCAPPA